MQARNGAPGWDRFSAFDAWHVLTVPSATQRVTESHCGGNCVLTGIVRHVEALADASTDAARAEALFFLGHWVADIHQPHHVSVADELGGDRVAVWDSILLEAVIGGREGSQDYADRLARRITPAARDTWVGSQPIAWAQESYDLSTGSRTAACAAPACAPFARDRLLHNRGELQAVVDVRLQQAGARLADLIRQHLAVHAR